jgi:energy-coupling factor transporter ATP-binding protein EcfA2
MLSRLSEFRVEALFGLYDHRIALNLEDRITIIIGPNGRGKTVCLKMIEALFRNRYGYIADIPFRLAAFYFTGGEVVTLHHADEAEFRTVNFSLQRPEKELVHWTPAIVDPRLAREMRRYIPRQWEQMGPDLWMDETDGEELTFLELARRYPVPPKITAALEQTTPDEFRALIGAIDCHLIETQRLLVLQAGQDDAAEEFIEYSPRRRRRDTRLVIQQKAQKLKAILKDTLTTYANLSQSLDSTYPLRVFDAQGSANLSQDQLRQELSRLDERRQALMSAGIMDTEYRSVKLRRGNIEPGVAMALEIYVKDAVQKLNVFNSLRSRLDLFKELIDKRFIDKSLQIDRELGFKITSKTGIGVPLEKLSSGEQHQLILVFDLLFEVTENSLILIDEPELSLHVAWQKTFIESLKRIIALNAFDVLLATHSPAVVARHFGLAVELGPVE